MTKDEPASTPLGVSDDGAVDLCRRWMAFLGAEDAVAASGATRELCDIFSSRYLGWVDNSRTNLDSESVVRAARVATNDGRSALIFKRGGIRPMARAEADRRGVALFSFVAVDGLLEGANELGQQLRASGLDNV